MISQTPYAFFDVDGTVIAKDSFFRILKWRASQEPWRLIPLALFLPLFVATYIFKWDRRYAKSALLWSLTFLKSKRNIVKIFTRDLAPILFEYWFQEANTELEKLRTSGVRICYVSASGQLWLRALLRYADPHDKIIIGSRLRFFFSGVVLASKNCYREEKLRRIHERLGSDIQWAAGYSDHIADIPMLSACAIRTLVNPKKHHLKTFETKLPKPFSQVTWHTREQKARPQ